MKMQKAQIEVIEFDSGDVIVTSGGLDIDPTGQKILIMDIDSISNYNTYANTQPDHIQLEIEENAGWLYYGYSGMTGNDRNKTGEGTEYSKVYQYTSKSMSTPSVYTTMPSDNIVQYGKIRAWLEANAAMN